LYENQRTRRRGYNVVNVAFFASPPTNRNFPVDTFEAAGRQKTFLGFPFLAQTARLKTSYVTAILMGGDDGAPLACRWRRASEAVLDRHDMCGWRRLFW
jgi:hypothetical protein